MARNNAEIVREIRDVLDTIEVKDECDAFYSVEGFKAAWKGHVVSVQNDDRMKFPILYLGADVEGRHVFVSTDSPLAFRTEREAEAALSTRSGQHIMPSRAYAAFVPASKASRNAQSDAAALAIQFTYHGLPEIDTDAVFASIVLRDLREVIRRLHWKPPDHHAGPITANGEPHEDLTHISRRGASLHWAFDRGLLGVGPDRKILVPPSVRELPGNEFLRDLHGNDIREANPASLRAIDEALEWHRTNVLIP